MAKVAIVMGSDSDMPVMAQAADVLEKLGVDFEITVISAHREPDIFFEYAKTAEARGVKVMIAGAGQQPSQRSNRVNVAVTHGSEGYDCPPETVADIFEGFRLCVAFDVVHQNARET